MLLRRRVAHAVVIGVGLLIMAYPLTVGATPAISCRGVAMHPGDSCGKADGKAVQTYQERAATAAEAKPVIIVVGALLVAFGAMLLVSELRRGSARSAS